MRGLEVLQTVHKREMGRREFLKLLGGAGASAFVFEKFSGLASADTSLLPWDNQDVEKQRLEVAARFGFDDQSRSSGNWRPAGDGGWVFKSPDNFQHPLRIAGVDGRGVELRGWQKVKTIYGEVALVIAHRNVQLVEVLEATVYPHKNPWDGWFKLADEAGNQRVAGQIVMPLNDSPFMTADGDISLFSYGNDGTETNELGRRNAATIHGVPGTWSGDWRNWTTFDGGSTGDRYAKLMANPNGLNSGALLKGGVAQGFVAVERTGGLPAVPFVAHPDIDNYGGIFGTEMTFRISDNRNALWRTSFDKLRAYERSIRSNAFVMPMIR